jgi:hypothetical protein
VSTQQVIVEADSLAGPLTAVKGLLLQTSLEELKGLGYFEGYSKLLDAEQFASVTGYLGNEWVPLEVMRTHYRACDGLLLTPQQLDQVGQRVVDRLNGRMLASLARTARGAGYDLWSAVAPMHRMAMRLFQGSTARVVRVSPKDMETTVYGNPLFEFQYFRVAFCGAARGMFVFLGSRTTYAKVTHHSLTRSEFTVRVSWV